MSKNNNKKKSANSSKRSSKGDQPGGNRRELVYKEDGQEYGKIIKALGDSRFQMACSDNRVRMGKVRGTMRNRVYVKVDDIVLIGLRDFDEDSCDIIHKFYETEASTLCQYGEIPAKFLSSTGGQGAVVGEEEEDSEEEVFTFERIQAI